MCCDVILFMWCMAGDWSRYVYIHVWWKLSFTKQNQSQKNIFFSNMSIVRETAVFLFFSWYCLLLYSIVWDLICLPISRLVMFARFIMCLEKKTNITAIGTDLCFSQKRSELWLLFFFLSYTNITALRKLPYMLILPRSLRKIVTYKIIQAHDYLTGKQTC